MEVFSYILVGVVGILVGVFLSVIVDAIREHRANERLKQEQQKLLEEETNQKMLEFIENYNKEKTDKK